MNDLATKGEYLDRLLRSKQTVFSTKDIALLWGEKSEADARVRLSYYVKNGKLIRVHHGLYAKDKHYDRFELATKIYTPSYVSFETVLTNAGVVFQYYSQIFAASYLSREIAADGQTYIYRKLKDPLLTSRAGVEQKNTYAIASPERAFLDIVYLNKHYHFDNLSPLDFDKIAALLPIYKNKRMEKTVMNLRRNA